MQESQMDDKAHQPAVEPEIIPPDRPAARPNRNQTRAWITLKTRQGSYDYVGTPGPLAIMLALLALGGLAVVVLLILLGTFLVLIPLLVVLVGVLIVSALLSRGVRRIRGP
jgi:hypothetical protein